jgi:hypothetical protein
VVRQDARRALPSWQPRVVMSSWPPAGNEFEREVFSTPSVQVYIVISTDHEFGVRNCSAYRRQEGYQMTRDERLSRLVLPPELDPAVYVFRRTP